MDITNILKRNEQLYNCSPENRNHITLFFLHTEVLFDHDDVIRVGRTRPTWIKGGRTLSKCGPYLSARASSQNEPCKQRLKPVRTWTVPGLSQEKLQKYPYISETTLAVHLMYILSPNQTVHLAGWRFWKLTGKLG